MTNTTPTPYRKKLIEVALPLEAINKASAREKSIRHGHPSTLHLWWARRPLAACRAVLFSSLVDDPDSDPQFADDPDAATTKRAELFDLIEDLVLWENTNNMEVINRARAEIARCVASRKMETGELAKDEVVFGSGKGKPHPAGALSGAGVTPWEVAIRCARPEVVDAFLAEHGPAVLDPFCGGGSIPLEAQRLGLRAHASDLNPVAVLITKALIEIPPKFANQPPVHPGTDARMGWSGAAGMAEDVRHYGKWMRDEAEKRIGHLYPKVKITQATIDDGRPDLKPYKDQELTVIAWLWARTVASPDPSVRGKHVPLVRSFWLSKKKGKEAYVRPLIDRDKGTYEFKVYTGTPSNGFDPDDGIINRKGGRCLISGSPMPFPHIRDYGKRHGLGVRLMAIVCEGSRGRVYLSPDRAHAEIAATAEPKDFPNADLPGNPRDFKTPNYGLRTFADLFTPRQLTALVTFSDLVQEARARVLADARACGFASGGAETASLDGEKTSLSGSHTSGSGEKTSGSDEKTAGKSSQTAGSGEKTSGERSASVAGHSHPARSPRPPSGNMPGAADDRPLAEGGAGPHAYADAVVTMLGLSFGKLTVFHNTLGRWRPNEGKSAPAFGRQALPMIWDFPEVNAFAGAGGDWTGVVDGTARTLERLPTAAIATVRQADAVSAGVYLGQMIATDPPYYDNIGYADLSDFFYIWLRRSIGSVFPQLFATLLTPKTQELIASPYRHDGSKAKAAAFFENGLGSAIGQWRKHNHAGYPTTIFYAFKQAETDTEGTASTGWETFLDGVIKHGFSITGTWPMRTEGATRLVGMGTNALASSVVLVCIPRADDAPLATRREFLDALKAELPDALRNLQSGNIAPVDLAQAAIGPGMAVFSRYSKVMESDGSAMTVRTALSIINQSLDEVLAEQEGEFDSDTRWAVAWFEQFGVEEGPFGDADNMARAKNTAVKGLVDAGILHAGGGKVRLLGRDELPKDWDPASDDRLTIWEVVQHLIRILENDGETAAAALVKKLGGAAETARDLAYRLYTISERKKWSQEALAFNGLVIAWPELSRLAMAIRSDQPVETQAEMF